MKKTASLFLVFIMIASLFVSCGNKNPDVPYGMKLVENEYTTYKLYIPKEWTPDVTTGFTSAYANDKSNISLLLMNWDSSKYLSIEEYCTHYYESLSSTFKEVSERELSSENQKFGDMNALKYVYTMVSDGVSYKVMQTFSYNAGCIYIFTYTATEENYEKHLDEVNSIVENFRT
ncbi:MAG: hypothetical protein ACI4QR_04750 [Eubacteriales bacterium]